MNKTHICVTHILSLLKRIKLNVTEIGSQAGSIKCKNSKIISRHIQCLWNLMQYYTVYWHRTSVHVQSSDKLWVKVKEKYSEIRLHWERGYIYIYIYSWKEKLYDLLFLLTQKIWVTTGTIIPSLSYVECRRMFHETIILLELMKQSGWCTERPIERKLSNHKSACSFTFFL